MCKMNKCVNEFCSNVVSDNRHSLCQKCHEKEREARFLAETNECATDGCANRVPKEYRFCRKCYAEYKARSQAAMEVAAKSRQIQTAQQAEKTLRAELLAEVQTESLREGAVIKSRNGSQVIVTYQGKSYTLTDEAGALRLARSKEDATALKRHQELEATRKAEEEKARQAAEIQRVFAQIKDDTLEDAIVDRSGKTISVLYNDGRVLTFDDPDVLAEEKARQDASVAASKAARKSEQKSKGKSEGKGKGKGREQRASI